MTFKSKARATHKIVFDYVGKTELGRLSVHVESFYIPVRRADGTDDPVGELWIDHDSPDVLDHETVSQAMRRTRVAMSKAISGTCPARDRIRKN